MCVQSKHTFEDINMPDVTTTYKISLIKYLLILLRFLGILHIIDDYLCLKCCISTKLSQIVYLRLRNTHILICWHARCYYKLKKILWQTLNQIITVFVNNNKHKYLVHKLISHFASHVWPFQHCFFIRKCYAKMFSKIQKNLTH